MVQDFGQSTWSANYNTTVYGSSKGSSTTVGAYYTGYYYTGCSSATVGTSGATVYRYFSPANYTVICIDVDGTNTNGTELGRSTFSAAYNSTVYGSAKGSDTSKGKYYSGYSYTGCTSAKVTTSGATVYRFFSAANYLVICIDVIGNNNGAELGRTSWSTTFNSTVSGGDLGTDTSDGAYYSNFIYENCSTETVSDEETIVYRYFRKSIDFEMPETGSISKILFFILGIVVIIYSNLKKKGNKAYE